MRISLLILLLTALLLIPGPVTYSASAPLLAVTPANISEFPGASFTVGLELGQVSDLTSYDVTLKFQGQVLTATEVTVKPVMGKTFRVLSSLRDDGTGTVRVIAGLGGDSVSIPTAAEIFSVKFLVDTWGQTPLDITSAKLSILTNGFPTVVEADATDGLFITPPLFVDLDIKPGSSENPINVKEMGEIPVAILTTSTFDASAVVVSSVRFGRTGVEASPVNYPTGGALEDVDGDGDLDHVLHFSFGETGIRAGDTEAKITGVTILGVSFEGTDSIRAFFPGDANGDLRVNIIDLALVGAAFGSSQNSPNWNPYADFDENKTINILDLATVGLYFGKSA